MVFMRFQYVAHARSDFSRQTFIVNMKNKCGKIRWELTRGNDASMVDKLGKIMAPRSSQLIFPLSLVRQIDSHSLTSCLRQPHFMTTTQNDRKIMHFMSILSHNNQPNVIRKLYFFFVCTLDVKI